MEVGQTKGILEAEGINAARSFLGYPPLPDNMIEEAEKNSAFVQDLRGDALRRLNEILTPHGVILS